MIKFVKLAQSGRSMIEMLGVLAIVGVLSAGGIAGYSMAMQTHKTNTLIEKIQLIANRVRSICKNGDYSAISNTALTDSGKLNTEDLENPFGGSFVVGSDTTPVGTFFVRTLNIPSEACVDLLQTDWGDSGVFYGIFFDGGTPNFINISGTYPVSTTDAISACNNSSNDLYLFFK